MLSQSKSTVISVANAIALATAVVNQVAGDEVANTLNGQPVNKAALVDLVSSRLHANFSTYTKGAVS